MAGLGPENVLAAGVLIVAIALYALSSSRAPSEEKRILWQENSTNPQYMTEWLSNHSRPVVLINTPFSTWRSVNWTPELLADQIPKVLAKKSKNNIFKYFSIDQPLSTVTAFKLEKEFSERGYSGKQFFHKLPNSTQDYYYYSSGGIELLELRSVFKEHSLLKVTFGNFEPGQVNFWFGGENVTAYTHYDTSHNLHAVMYGRKRFLLFPSSSYKVLKLYPSLHQLYRHVQTDILNISEARYNTLWADAGGLEVVLKPGEVLYIPPYWFHCVITLETTISLNVWSQSSVYLTMEDIYASPIPFEEVWGTVKLMRILQHYITLILQAALPQYSSYPSYFIRVAVLSRYDSLLPRIEENRQSELLASAGVFCLQSNIEELLDTPSLRHLNKGASNIGALFQSMTQISSREINMANYLEHLAWRILGTEKVALIPFYFKKCF